MQERVFFFQFEGDTRKVQVPNLDSLSDLIPLVISKYADKNISHDPVFFTKDNSGVRFEISTHNDIYDGAIVEVMSRELMESNRSGRGGRDRYEPYPQGRGGYQASGTGHAGGPDGFNDGHAVGPDMFNGGGQFQSGPENK